MTEIPRDPDSLVDLMVRLTGLTREQILLNPPAVTELADHVATGYHEDDFLDGRVACTLGWRVARSPEGEPIGFHDPADPTHVVEITPEWCSHAETARTLSLPGWTSVESYGPRDKWRVSLWRLQPRSDQPNVSVRSDSLPRAIVAAWLLARIHR